MSQDIFCRFTQIESKIFRCIKCGVSIEILDNYSEAPVLLCSSSLNRDTTDNAAFSSAIMSLSDTKNSEELADDDLLIYRHNICTGCEFFNGSTCEKCGCPVSRVKAFANKLAIKNNRCPIDKW